MTQVLDLDAIRRVPVQTDPYTFIHGDGLVRPELVAALQDSFPRIRQAGFHPADGYESSGAFADLLADLRSPEFGEALSAVFGQDFTSLPQLITVRRVSAAHEGRIHTDGDKKVMSLLLYLNDDWTSEEGRLRILRGETSFSDYAVEIPPLTGAFVAFLRSDCSWHGHTPFVGERRVVQVAWLRSQEDLERKQATHRLSGALKRLFGGKRLLH